MEIENTGFDEFMEAFGEDSGYQTEPEEASVEEEGTQHEQDNVSEETEQEQPDQTAENETEEPEQKKPEQESEQTFTLKVNKEERTVGLAEMTELAQKGADYDRVKGQLTEERQTAQTLREQLNAQAEVMEILDAISQSTGISASQVMEQVHLNLLMNQGKTEAEARAEIRATKAEKKLADISSQQTKQKSEEESRQSRAQKEVKEFSELYPDVKLTKELIEQLNPDVRAGVSLANAYQKLVARQKDEQIAELQRQLAAAQQNKKNRAASPGGQADSGGRRGSSDFDDFMSAFN